MLGGVLDIHRGTIYDKIDWVFYRAIRNLPCIVVMWFLKGKILVCRRAYGNFRRVNLETLAEPVCEHLRTHEVGGDFDEDGRMLRLVRCLKCGLLIREYLPAVN